MIAQQFVTFVTETVTSRAVSFFLCNDASVKQIDKREENLAIVKRLHVFSEHTNTREGILLLLVLIQMLTALSVLLHTIYIAVTENYTILDTIQQKAQ